MGETARKNEQRLPRLLAALSRPYRTGLSITMQVRLMGFCTRFARIASMKKLPLPLLCLLFLLAACGSGGVGAPVSSQEGTPKLTSTLSLEKEQVYTSPEHRLIFRYPQDWSIHGGEYVKVDPSPEDYPKEDTLVSARQTRFEFYTTVPWQSRQASGLRIPEPATVLAQNIAYTFNKSDLPVEVGPIEAVDINGRDGATFLIVSERRHHYIVVLRIAEDKSVVLSALGLPNRSEEMQNVLNAIALNIEPLD